MKRFLSLILMLLLCVGFVASCNKSEKACSQDESNGLITTESQAEYYYHSDLFETSNTKRQVQIAESMNDLLEKLYILNPNVKAAPRYVDEQVFSTHYVIILSNDGCGSNLMGYRDVSKTEDGYVIIADTYMKYDDRVFVNGMAGFGSYIVPETTQPKIIGKYRVLLIPKNEFEMPPIAETIKIHKVVYRLTK